MSALELIRKARKRLATPGVWAQGGACFGEGRDCLATAFLALPKGNAYDAAIELVSQALAKQGTPRDALGARWAGWNDAPSRTLEDVLELLDSLL